MNATVQARMKIFGTLKFQMKLLKAQGINSRYQDHLEPGHNTNYVTLTLPKSRMDKSLVHLAAFFLCCPGSALDFLIL